MGRALLRLVTPRLKLVKVKGKVRWLLSRLRCRCRFRKRLREKVTCVLCMISPHLHVAAGKCSMHSTVMIPHLCINEYVVFVVVVIVQLGFSIVFYVHEISGDVPHN